MRKNRRTAANLSSIGKGGQLALSRSCIGIAGLGGVGGVAFEMLVRAGVGTLKISDGGFFEESNANRQSLWSLENNARGKTDAALLFAASQGAVCRVLPFREITRANAEKFARGCAAVIDATDSRNSRSIVFSGCKKAAVPHIFASARGHGGMLTVFSGKNPSAHFLLRCAKKPLSCDHALGPVANAIGCLAAQQAINVILKKPLVGFPRVLSIDGFSSETATVHCF